MSTSTSVHDISVKTIDHHAQSLSSYKGKVLLIVNTASACGFTGQYAGLEKLWQEYKDRGLAVLGFPSNDFGAQEPGSEAEIQAFCSLNYGVSFPLFSKIKTKGPERSPLYGLLAEEHGPPQWNFHKYLVGKDGRIVRAFPSSVAPDDPQLRAAIDAALAQA
jgi:glutathione peroxidase